MKKIISVLVVLLGLQSYSYGQNASQVAAEKNFEKFKQFYSILYNYYMDTVDYKKLIETAIGKSLENLDPHSAYLPPKEASSENDRLRGNFEGIGISYQIIRDTLQVVDVIANGPSEKIGLLVGDKMLKINDTLWAGKSKDADHYVSRLRGKKGTQVVVSMLRAGKVIDFTITRDVIPLYSVDASFMIDNHTGYIRLNKFANTTPFEIDTAMKKLKAMGMKHLILDLQTNGGGLLTAAVALVDEFIPEDKLIVYTEGIHSPKQSYNSTASGNFKKGKLILLVNEHSASASEITAGAIQDWDRGLIIGRRTFGKGLVQRPFTMIDNSQIRLTTAQYFIPSGRFIQKPYTADKKDYRDEIIHRMQSGQLTKSDTVRVPDSLMKLTANGRKVYGGGGITPDIYVPIDTSYYSDYYNQIWRKSILNTYCTDYATNNKKELMTQYPNEDYFVKSFRITDKDIEGLVTLAEKEGIKRSDSSVRASKKLFETVLKANIARNLYSSQAFYKVILDIDPIYQRAIAVMDENFSKYKVRNE